MGDSTGISWTDATWNVTRGCRRISPGCENCYAERQANRFAGPGGAYDGLVKRTPSGPRWTGKTIFAADHLADPLRWKAPRRIFVDSMSDLFFEGFTNEQIAAAFGVMAACPQHTFQVLTKRARRMREWFEWAHGDPLVRLGAGLTAAGITDRDTHRMQAYGPNDRGVGNPWPLRNVWLGVSVENQEAADERIPDLLRTSAAVRFLSCEPLLGPVMLPIVHVFGSYPKPPGIDWIIAGCESGPGARPCSVEWLRSLRDQCATAGVPFFLKQAMQSGSEVVGGPLVTPGKGSKRKGRGVIELPYLDGVQHAEFPR